MKIFLIRHGESIANIGENQSLGLADHKVPLTSRGLEQAKMSAMVLKEYINSNQVTLSHARVWYSPFDRAKQTMEKFNSELCFEESGIDMRENILLTEQQFGLFDSVPKERWRELYPNEYTLWNKVKSQRGKFWAPLPMGESPFNVAVRLKQFFGTIQRDFDRHGVDTLFIFTHGTTLRCFIMQYLHYPSEWYENEQNPGNCWIRFIEDKNDYGYIYKG